MADNINVTPGSGTTVAADDVGGVLHQRVKVVLGIDGVSDGDISTTNPMPMTASALPLPAGASTATAQSTGNASIASIDTKTPALGQALAAVSTPVVLTAAQISTLTPLSSVSVSNFPATQPVSGTVSISNSSIEIANDAGNPIPVSGTVTANTGLAQPITDTQIRATALPISGSVSVSNFPSTQAVSIATMPSTPVTGTFFQATQPVSATALPLPSGASTETTLSTINGKVPSLGQASMSASTPVVISSNQTSMPVKIQDSTGLGLNSIVSAGVNNLLVAQGGTNYIASTANSTTTQLAAGATFTGTIETVFNQQSYSILLTADQAVTITLNQYIDASGTFLAQSSVFILTAGQGFARSAPINGNYFNISVKNNGASTTTTLNLNSAYGTIPSSTQLNNAPTSINEIAGTALTQPYLPVNQEGTKATYSAALTGIITATLPTDIFTITGSSTKTIRIIRMELTATQTTGTQRDVLVIKRSTVNSGGTVTGATSVPHDSASPAATAQVQAYTVNPATLGTIVGVIRSKKVYIGVTTSTSDALDLDFGNRPSQAIVLRGNQVLAINLNSATSAGDSINCYVEWTEE